MTFADLFAGIGGFVRWYDQIQHTETDDERRVRLGVT